jgi:signal transduction histidine kinase
MSVAFVLASIMEAGGYSQLWTLLYAVFVLHIAFTFEKFARLNFLESKKIALIESTKRVLQRQIYETKLELHLESHELELMSIQTEEEKRLYDKEREALTSLIGNVAHDLKTPLQSFTMNLELLKTCLAKDPGVLPPITSADRDDEHPLIILLSLNSACDFMKMAIIRSIDFAKSSSNIALVPAMETFNISEALSMPVDVIRHLQSNIEIVVKPLPLNFCEDMISDKHWFSENVLCLLSNAVKYSDGGTVTVSIELIKGMSIEMSGLFIYFCYLYAYKYVYMLVLNLEKV